MQLAFMRNTALFLMMCAFTLPSYLFSQQKDCVFIDWSKHYGGFENDGANDVVQTPDGGFVAVGFSRSSNQQVASNNGLSDFWIAKTDADGTLEWEQSFGGSLNDIASSVALTADGGYLIAGGAVSFDQDVMGNQGEEDVWLVKLSGDGNFEWSRTYGGSSNDRMESIRPTSDGNFILAGYSQSNDGDVDANFGEFDYWLMKIDAAGNIIWENNFGGSMADFGFDARETMDGGYLMIGSTFSDNGNVTGNNGFYDYWIVKTDALGNFEWQRNFGGAGEERSYALELLSDGSAIIGGTSNSSSGTLPGNNGSADYWIMRIDMAGDLIWSKNFGGSAEDRAFALGVTSDNGFLLAGFSSSSNMDVGGNYGSKDGWLIKFDSNGDIIWEKNFGGSADDRLYAILETAEGGYIGAGLSTSSDFDLDGNFGNQDLWLIRLAPDSLEIDLGNDTTLCAGEAIFLEIDIDDVTYTWQDGSNDDNFIVQTAGEYWVEIDKEGCIARDTLLVDYVSETPVELGNDTILCVGETLILDPGIPGANYVWSNGSSDQTQAIVLPTTISVDVSKDGCNYQDTISVDFTTVEVDLGNDTLICEGNTLLYDLTVPSGTYLWQDGSTSASYEIFEPGNYFVEVSQGGCSNSDTLVVGTQFEPDSVLSNFRFVCPDNGIWFDVENEGASYLWQDGSTEPRLKAVVPGEYWVEVTLSGCVFRQETELVDCEKCLYVPNIFSPNGDGINDEFRTFPGCEFTNYQMQVFNRWGGKVFESETPNESWDGDIQSEKAQQGTYIYVLTFDILNNGITIPQDRRGTVELIR